MGQNRSYKLVVRPEKKMPHYWLESSLMACVERVWRHTYRQGRSARWCVCVTCILTLLISTGLNVAFQHVGFNSTKAKCFNCKLIMYVTHKLTMTPKMYTQGRCCKHISIVLIHAHRQLFSLTHKHKLNRTHCHRYVRVTTECVSLFASWCVAALHLWVFVSACVYVGHFSV